MGTARPSIPSAWNCTVSGDPCLRAAVKRGRERSERLQAWLEHLPAQLRHLRVLGGRWPLWPDFVKTRLKQMLHVLAARAERVASPTRPNARARTPLLRKLTHAHVPHSPHGLQRTMSDRCGHSPRLLSAAAVAASIASACSKHTPARGAARVFHAARGCARGDSRTIAGVRWYRSLADRCCGFAFTARGSVAGRQTSWAHVHHTRPANVAVHQAQPLAAVIANACSAATAATGVRMHSACVTEIHAAILASKGSA